MNQVVAKAMLARLGHEVVVVENGRQALAAIDTRSFDIVLMDVHMPEMDGLEATRLLRLAEAGTARRLPVVALTARAMAGDREMLLESGMDGYLSKPLRAEALRIAIEEAVGAPCG